LGPRVSDWSTAAYSIDEIRGIDSEAAGDGELQPGTDEWESSVCADANDGTCSCRNDAGYTTSKVIITLE